MKKLSISILLRTVFAAVVLGGTALTAQANTIVFVNTNNAGSQGDYILGMDFLVNSPVIVTQLGAFDDGLNGFTTEVTVGIFAVTGVGELATPNGTGTLVGLPVTFIGLSGTLIGNSRFLPVTPFTLTPGRYSIVASGFDPGGSNQNGNTGLGGTTTFNTLGGALTLISKGGRWELNPAQPFEFPDANLGGYSQADPVFQAGTFAVPDGGATVALLGFVLIGVEGVRRKLKIA